MLCIQFPIVSATDRIAIAHNAFLLQGPNFWPLHALQVDSEQYGYGDIYNFCALRLARKYNNSGPDASDMLFDLPLSWFDQDWAGCQDSRKAVNGTRWEYLAGNFFTMHTRYPKNPEVPQRSPLHRGVGIVDGFFGKCSHAGCVPLHGSDLLSFEGFDLEEAVWKKQQRRLRSVVW